VVEKGIGISHPIGKPTNRKGGHADEERIWNCYRNSQWERGVSSGAGEIEVAACVRAKSGMLTDITPIMVVIISMSTL